MNKTHMEITPKSASKQHKNPKTAQKHTKIPENTQTINTLKQEKFRIDCVSKN